MREYKVNPPHCSLIQRSAQVSIAKIYSLLCVRLVDKRGIILIFPAALCFAKRILQYIKYACTLIMLAFSWLLFSAIIARWGHYNGWWEQPIVWLPLITLRTRTFLRVSLWRMRRDGSYTVRAAILTAGERKSDLHDTRLNRKLTGAYTCGSSPGSV